MNTTTFNFPRRRSTMALVLVLAIIKSCLVMVAKAQHAISDQRIHVENRHDPDFPGKRKFNAGIMSTYTSITPPPALVGDATYGISEKTSFGLMGGTTGAQSLAGVKFNAVLFQRGSFRVISRTVIVYYPGREGQYMFDRSEKSIMPWMLSMSVVETLWRSNRRLQWSFGMGVLETHCIEGMKRYFWGSGDQRKESPFEVFHTAQGSVSIPLSGKLTLRPEVIAVMKDARLIRFGEFKVFPINPFVKVIYTF